MKNKIICTITVLFSLLFFLNAKAQNNIGINTTSPDVSAALDVTYTTGSPKGILIPRVTTTQRTTGIASPANGLMVYDTDLKAFYFYNGTAWTAVGNSASSGISLQLFVTKTTSQITPLGSNMPGAAIETATVDIPFQSTNTGTLTGGNTWDGTTFTVGASGAGLYQIDVRLTGVVMSAIPMLDFGGGYATSSIYGMSQNVPSGGTSYSSVPAFCKRGILTTTVYLPAGAFFKVRASSTTTVVGADLNGDASCRLTIVKLN